MRENTKIEGIEGVKRIGLTGNVKVKTIIPKLKNTNLSQGFSQTKGEGRRRRTKE
jgi:hypothetical protein